METTMTFAVRFPILAWLTCSAALIGCGSAPVEGGEIDRVDETKVDLSGVPTDVQCVKVVVTVGTQTVTPPLQAVMPGASAASLSLGQLPAGNATFNGSGFNVACASVTSSTVATWIADPTMATLSPGIVTTVSMTFRRNNPVMVSANFLDNVAEIATGTSGTYARMVDGTVREWGYTADGLGSLATPTTVLGLTGIVQIAGGDNFACARKNNGTIFCWGSNTRGQLGPSVAIGAQQTTPVLIPVITAASDLAAGSTHVCAVNNTATYCWGGNSSGQLGDGTATDNATPHIVNGAGAAGRVYAGANHTCLLDSSGGVECWGSNAHGQLGDGSTINRSTPVAVSGLGDTIDLALGNHSCALRADGLVRCWGDNSIGQVGDGTFMQQANPVAVMGMTDAVQIGAGVFHTCARRANGSVWCWGNGAQLGDAVGNTVNVPVAVATLTANVKAVRSHLGQHTCAEMADRTVRCWGWNGSQQIGDGTSLFASKPTPVVLQ
jgi:alpha-tubulin suppressor-like RCC1 family protein